MNFDFLPNNTPPPKPSTEESAGSKFSVGKNFFFDNYKNHLDANSLFRVPLVEKDFVLKENFDTAFKTFSSSRVALNIKTGFYGENTEYDILINGYTKFQNPKLLKESIKKIDASINQEMFSKIQKPKININDRFGIFSYDLASMAMTYVYEYFDGKGNKVNSNFVVKRKNKFFKTGSKIEVFQKIKKRKNGTPVVVSSVRKVFIDFDKKNKKDRSVEILVNNSFHFGEKSDDIIYNSMAAISVAKNLILKGFKVKLTALLVCTNADKQYYHFVPVKRFNQPLDINAAAYVLGDSRFFRYQGFKMIIKGQDLYKHIVPSGIGSIINDSNYISKVIEKDYIHNSELDQADTRLYFGGSRNLQSSIKEVEKAIEILNQKYSSDE